MGLIYRVGFIADADSHDHPGPCHLPETFGSDIGPAGNTTELIGPAA